MNTLKKYLQAVWNEPYLRFIVSFIALSGIFYGFNVFYIGITAKGGVYIPFLDQYLNYIRWWRDFTIYCTASILRWLDYTVISNSYQLRVIGKSGFNIVYSCLGYGIMGVFAAFAITFPEKIRRRIVFLIVGLVIIQLLNIVRLVLISIYWKKGVFTFNMDHHDLFNLIVYIILILFTICWLGLSRKRNTT
jgi:exosortase/archaeosortase family protein